MRRPLILLASLALATASALDAGKAYRQNQALLALSRGEANTGTNRSGDPAVRLAGANALLTTNPAAVVPGGGEAARAVLARSPLEPAALFVLGSLAEQREPGSGLGAFALAERISRREIGNELTLARTSLANGDTDAGLAHLDRVMSVSPGAAQPLARQLAPSLADAGLRGHFARYAARPWYPELIDAAAAANLPGPVVAAVFASANGAQPPALMADLRRNLAWHALSADDAGTVLALLATLPAADRAAFDHFAITAQTSAASLQPFGWQLVSDEIKSARLADGGTLEITISSDRIGTVAERLTRLPPGPYRLAHAVLPAQGATAALSWDVACLQPAGLASWRQTVSTPASGGQWSALFAVPANCPVQRLRLIASGDPAQGESTARIGPVTLEPAR